MTKRYRPAQNLSIGALGYVEMSYFNPETCITQKVMVPCAVYMNMYDNLSPSKMALIVVPLGSNTTMRVAEKDFLNCY